MNGIKYGYEGNNKNMCQFILVLYCAKEVTEALIIFYSTSWPLICGVN